MSDKWIQEVKRVQNEYKKQGINLTYQQSMLLARDTYNQVKQNPNQPPPPIKVEPAKIPPFKSRSNPTPTPQKPRLAPHPYDYGYSYEPEPGYKPPAPRAPGKAPTGRGRGRPREVARYDEYEEEYMPRHSLEHPPRYDAPPPRRAPEYSTYRPPSHPPPRYRYEEGYEYEN